MDAHVKDDERRAEAVRSVFHAPICTNVRENVTKKEKKTRVGGFPYHGWVAGMKQTRKKVARVV